MMSCDIQSIKKRADFVNLSKKGVSSPQKGLVLQSISRMDESNENLIRFGVTATKKIGNAVSRNRAKRRMRALVSRFIKDNNTCFDNKSSYVLVAKSSLNKALFVNLYSEMGQCLNKLWSKVFVQNVL